VQNFLKKTHLQKHLFLKFWYFSDSWFVSLGPIIFRWKKVEGPNFHFLKFWKKVQKKWFFWLFFSIFSILLFLPFFEVKYFMKWNVKGIWPNKLCILNVKRPIFLVDPIFKILIQIFKKYQKMIEISLKNEIFVNTLKFLFVLRTLISQ